MRRAALALVLLLLACGGPAAPGPALSEAELKYRIFDQIGRPWYCDPDLYPIARGDEKEMALARFPEIARDSETYRAILRRLAIRDATTEDQKLLAYREWKQLGALQLEPTGVGSFRFRILVERRPEMGVEVDGTIDGTGFVRIGREQAAGPPMCPICLAEDTRIDTPRGEVRVGELRSGELVWTLDARGRRVAAPLVAVGATRAPAGHEVVSLVLADGRAVRLSPGHPLIDGRPAGALGAGDELDGSRVVSVERVGYAGETHDVLPAGPTMTYWANGVLLRSSLRR